MKAAIHFGPKCTENLDVYKKAHRLRGDTHKFLSDHCEEILVVNTIANTNPSWTRSLLSHDQVIMRTKAKVLVYSNSVLCLGKMLDHSEANQRWQGHVADFQLFCSYAELLRTDREPIEFEWHILPGLASLQILQKIHRDLQGRSLEPEEFGDVSSSFLCSWKLFGQRREMKKIVFKFRQVQDVREKILARTLDILGS